MQPQTQVFSNFTDEVGIIEQQARSDSDPRPFYLFTPGDHIHRVTSRDSVPHVWAGRVQSVKNHVHWIDANEAMTDGIQTKEIKRGSRIVKQVGLPVWAGSIVNNILRAHSDLFVTTLEAFEGRPDAEIDSHRFNCLISGMESFPYVIEPDWRVKSQLLNPLVPPVIDDWKKTPRKHLDLANEKGGLVVRRALAVSGAKAIQGSSSLANGNAHLYLSAIEEILASYDRFASQGHLYLDEQERIIQSTKEEGKGGYDPYDRYLLWLLGRKGIETARGVTRDDMESLIGAVKGNTQPVPSMSREDIAAIASAAAMAAVSALPKSQTEDVGDVIRQIEKEDEQPERVSDDEHEKTISGKQKPPSKK